jgi:dihydroorotate dehydrogenase
MGAKKPMPLYDITSSFFQNYEKGPRSLSKSESLQVQKLNDEIVRLESGGASTRSRIFPNFEVGTPFGVASGIAYGSKFLSIYKELGYGFLTQKTVRDRRWEGNPMPHVFYLKGGSFEEGFTVSEEPTEMMCNSFGMPSVGPEVWIPELTAFKKANPDVPLIISGVATQAKTSEEMIRQHAEIGRNVEKIGADAYEINVSCPNEMEGHTGELQDNLPFISDVLQELTSKLKIPILAKIGYRENLSEFARTAGKILDGKGGIVAINVKPGIIRNKEGGYAYGEKRPRAGVGYSPINGYALDVLKQLIEVRQESGYDFKIFSVGGIARPEEVSQRLKLGADAVEAASSAMSDPTLALRVRKHLLEQSTK